MLPTRLGYAHCDSVRADGKVSHPLPMRLPPRPNCSC